MWHWTDQHAKTFNQAKWTVKFLGTLDTSELAELTIHVTLDDFDGVYDSRLGDMIPPWDFGHSYGRWQRNVIDCWKNNCVPLFLPSLLLSPSPEK